MGSGIGIRLSRAFGTRLLEAALGSLEFNFIWVFAALVPFVIRACSEFEDSPTESI